VHASSETQGLLAYLQKSPWELTLTEPVPEIFEFAPLIGQKNLFFWPISGTNSKISGTGSVRVSSQGLFCPSNKLAAPGSPRIQ